MGACCPVRRVSCMALKIAAARSKPKGLLIEAFERLRVSKEPNACFETEIYSLEKTLEDEVTFRIQECEGKNADKMS